VQPVGAVGKPFEVLRNASPAVGSSPHKKYGATNSFRLWTLARAVAFLRDMKTGGLEGLEQGPGLDVVRLRQGIADIRETPDPVDRAGERRASIRFQ
jgi:hypothetical protein